MNIFISIILPVRNEEKYITECLDSILNSDYQKDLIEVIVVDGDSTDNTLNIVREYESKYDFIKVIINKRRIVPISLNLAIKDSKGDYIVRIDAHCHYPRNYFSKLVFWAEKLGADNVGAVIETDVLFKNKTSVSIKIVMSDILGVGDSLFRLGINSPKIVDTVPFGCFKKSVFEKFGNFDERLVRCQDIEFNKRIKGLGAEIYLIPDNNVVYYARETYRELFINRYETGKWVVRTICLTRSFASFGVRHLVPTLFVTSILFLLLLSIFFSQCLLLLSGQILLYFLILFIRSLYIYDGTTPFHVVNAFLVLHISYGVGSLVSIFSCLHNNNKVR